MSYDKLYQEIIYNLTEIDKKTQKYAKGFHKIKMEKDRMRELITEVLHGDGLNQRDRAKLLEAVNFVPGSVVKQKFKAQRAKILNKISDRHDDLLDND